MTDIKETPARSDVSDKDTWDLRPLFSNEDEWESEKKSLADSLTAIQAFKGILHKNSETLKQALDQHFSILEKLEDLYTYAHLLNDQDTTNPKGNTLLQKAQSLWVQYSSTSSFIAPELLATNPEILSSYSNDSSLAPYKTYLEELARRRNHTKSEGEEEILSLAGEVLGSSSKIFRQLNDADLTFESVEVNGNKHPLTHASYLSFLLNPSREVRKEAFTNYYTTFDQHKYTIATTLQSNLKKDSFIARVRGHASSRALGLFGDNIPEEVYDTLVYEIEKELPSALHPYYELRKSISNYSELYLYDTYIPLVSSPPKGVDYEEAVEILSQALLPLGEDYVQTMVMGLTKDRWVDRYENKGKRSGAYSSGSYNSPPYILMNYKSDSIDSLYTLAHEAGHSMHSWYAKKNQNYVNHSYTIFVAEVASTCNEILLTKYLLKKNKNDKAMCSYVLNHQLDAIKGTFFRQTMFAEFEKIIHHASDENEPLTIESFRSIYRSLLTKYFGPSLTFGVLDDLECLRIPHFYSSFYVFKYATGLSAAITLADRIYQKIPGAKESYLTFLSAGGSKYPLEVLMDAGVNLRTSEPILTTITLFKKTFTSLCTIQDWALPESFSE
jgi:oligoendopeptidase F